ncbi:MAG: ATP/GTP-binding protein [Thaumarchaeota archaeon]|nr:ATP/GTP-binding protein [Nitrososphaerota archaeon]
MYAIFIAGTAGSGKTTLTAALKPWYENKGNHTITVNLDPGALSLPYVADVDIRNYLTLEKTMEEYELGPNGALIMAADLMAAKLEEIQDDIDSYNADYAILDTPGQIELFAYRASGPYIIKNLRCDGKAVIFLFDSALVSSAVNLVSTALLATSVQLRLDCPQVPVLSKKDLTGGQWKQILRWFSDTNALTDALSKESAATVYLLSRGILSALAKTGFSHTVIPVSSVTSEGLVELSASLSRMLSGGEEAED